MKLFFTFFVFVFLLAGQAQSAVGLDEVFDYPDDVLSASSAWEASTGIGTWAGDFIVGGQALTYSSEGVECRLSGEGKTVNCSYDTPFGSSNYKLHRVFSEEGVSSGVVYLSFLFTPNGDVASQNQSYILGLGTPGSNTAAQVWFGAGKVNAEHFRFGTTRGSTKSAEIQWSSVEYSDVNATYLIVLKYDLDVKKTSVFINPVLGTEEEETPEFFDDSSPSNIKSTVQTIQFKVNGNQKQVFRVGGIAVGNTWAEAVAIKASTSIEQLPAPMLAEVSGLSPEGFTANWEEVSNASGYRISIFSDETLVVEEEVLGSSVVQYVAEHLASGSSYTYRVMALGDGLTYGDSEWSPVSETVLIPISTHLTSFPKSGKIFLSGNVLYGSESGRVQVYALSGQLVLEAQLNHSLPLNLPAGSYVLRFLSDEGKRDMI